MGIWSDLAVWRGPTSNQGGAMIEWRGVVLHIAEGTFEGTISWQKNPVSDVSSHFVVAKDGRIAQIVDTDITAWTQAQGNGHWLSIENEGFSGDALPAAQLEANARLYAKAVQVYGIPLQSTDTPAGTGLGWHGMGGVAWGNHPNCPGVPIRNQRTQILARASEILGSPPESEDDMILTIVPDASGALWLCNGMLRRKLGSQQEVSDLQWLASQGAIKLWTRPDGNPIWDGGLVPAFGIDIATLDDSVTGGGATPTQVRTVVREELNKTKLGV